jgi:hypothetical protein
VKAGERWTKVRRGEDEPPEKPATIARSAQVKKNFCSGTNFRAVLSCIAGSPGRKIYLSGLTF